jgi:hypothetical protein
MQFAAVAVTLAQNFVRRCAVAESRGKRGNLPQRAESDVKSDCSVFERNAALDALDSLVAVANSLRSLEKSTDAR